MNATLTILVALRNPRDRNRKGKRDHQVIVGFFISRFDKASFYEPRVSETLGAINIIADTAYEHVASVN